MSVFSLLLPSAPMSLLGLALLLTLAISALGFIRVDWFISIGYAFSIAAQAVVAPLLHPGTLDIWRVLQAVLLLAYGLRLGSFLIGRERSPSFAAEFEASRARSERVRGVYKVVIWIAVALLYVAMAAPAHLALAAPGPLPSLLPGEIVMLAGLLLEAAADRQKSRLKAAAPARFVRDGLFRLVRYPNYFGEMLFWLGAFVSGVTAYRTAGDWLLAGAGLVAIELVMLGSARRLELKQTERYGSDPEYQHYTRTVPALVPLLPIYSLRNLRVYLG